MADSSVQEYRVGRDVTDLNTHPLIMRLTDEEVAFERAEGRTVTVATGDDLQEYEAYWDAYYSFPFVVKEDVLV